MPTLRNPNGPGNALALFALLALMCAGVAGGAAAQGASACANASLVNPAPAPDAGEQQKLPGGMGGTGAIANAPIGGMGGTGAVAGGNTGGMGGTGIIGTVTGFASVCVNGVEVRYESTTPVSINGRTGQLRDLAVGQIVAIEASGLGANVNALSIEVLNAVEGPITRINAARGVLEVMAQQVRVNAQNLAPGTPALEALRLGERISVSGHRLEGGDIIASHITRSASTETPSIVGIVTAVDASGVKVNGTGIVGLRTAGRLQNEGVFARLFKMLIGVAHAQELRVQALRVGAEIRVRGEWDGSRLRASSFAIEPTRRALGLDSGRVERLVVEGFSSARSAGGQVAVGALRIAVPDAARGVEVLRAEAKVQVNARVLSDRSVRAESIESSVSGAQRDR